ncbi:hypothetical protein [Microbacterium sp. P03]|uniref:hypothetical protein n=1 Tax=Microbacterium sp. P03 TaxID=3366946 RepID=UPI003746EB8F
MSVATVTEHAGDRALAVIFGIAEAGVLLVGGAGMVAVVIVSYIVRLSQEAAERRRHGRAARLALLRPAEAASVSS